MAGLFGVACLSTLIAWGLWSRSVASEAVYEGGLAARLGQRTERTIVGLRNMLAQFDALHTPRCSRAHLDELRDAAVSRPYVRGIGYWHAGKRLCGVGFLPTEGIKPAEADRIYPSGVIAWWPSAQTEVGGVRLFLMRYGEHDVAIDPQLLLELGPTPGRRAGLWVEGLRMATVPHDAHLPPPETLPVGITMDQDHGVVYSHFEHDRIMSIDVIASEPIGNFWGRHALLLTAGIALALLLVVAWLAFVLRFSRYQLHPATELRRALAAGRISVAYQPVVDMRSGNCVGAEALARWTRDDGTAVSPAVFIPQAEAAGLIQDITLAMMRTVIRDLKRVFPREPHISVNLNLSGDDLKTDRIGNALAAQLRAAGLPTRVIRLEITERALVNNDTARAIIGDFRRNGHEVAVDDFGTGYSSLAYLQSFELDVLKIDKAFVDAIGTGAATSQVIVHVIEMAQSLGLKLVAEGVESEAQVHWLIEHGVAYAQGYLFSKALPLEEFLAFYHHRQASDGS